MKMIGLSNEIQGAEGSSTLGGEKCRSEGGRKRVDHFATTAAASEIVAFQRRLSELLVYRGAGPVRRQHAGNVFAFD